MTDHPLPDRREFLLAAAASAFAHVARSATGAEGKRRYLKAVKYGMVKPGKRPLDKFRLVKALGFDGIEVHRPAALPVEELKRASEQTGLPIHGVICSAHWRYPLSHPDPAVRARCRAALEQAIRDAAELNATSVLLVPAVVNKEIPYDAAYVRSQEEIRKVLPLAEELRIKVLFENVWNYFLLSPLEFARYVDEFESSAVGVYFDVGNIVNFGWPEQWIRILGKRIGKLDIKEFSRAKRDREGLWRGFDVEIGEGDCDWPAVRAALEDIGYAGWCTAEVPGGDEKRLAEILERMNRVLPG